MPNNILNASTIEAFALIASIVSNKRVSSVTLCFASIANFSSTAI